ncbi:hypothetical protein N0V87_010541 [Didymella glomerata]|uniref:Protein kinase domain-containing protein n=1 Tax=Didymella glomerata TaxID=749621 RepID=A0A9W9BUK9_9PLEO|nr:hypothetical protein N0V87_010541 [Didymella glomerata]
MNAAPAGSWPPIPPSVFTQSSDQSENEAFRQDPWRGVHKHGPACRGDVRALVYPLSAAAQTCCEEAPKEEGELPSIVRLRLCKQSTHFSIGSFLTSNITITSPDEIDEDDDEWKHLIQIGIYPDPDSDDVEVYNNTPHLTASISSDRGEEPHQLPPLSSFRLTAERSWSIRITAAHTYGIILRPIDDLYNALVSHTLAKSDEYKVFRTTTQKPNKRGEARVRFARLEEEEDEEESDSHLRRISPPAVPLSECSTQADEDGSVPVYSPSQVNKAPDLTPAVLKEDSATKVETMWYRNKLRVRKCIRSATLYAAARNWERETHILSGLDHPNIIKCLEFDSDSRSIDFEYGGKDLSKFQTKTCLFDVARDLDRVQILICTQTASALEYLHHEKQLIHCDIKPQNILLSDDHQSVKVCDFGCAQASKRTGSGGGTHHYIAPEYLLEQERNLASDVWSLGITMLYVLGLIPLPDSQPEDEYWLINKLKDDESEQRKMLRWLGKVKEALTRVPKDWAVLKAMLDTNPRTRITAAELVSRLLVMKEERAAILTN